MTPDQARAAAASRQDGVLEVDRVGVRFGGVVALERVSMRVAVGEIVGVIGPNGAGKTTLFNAVCGFVRPDAGSLRFRGRSLDGVRPHDLPALGIARTLQGLGLWAGLTALENVMAGAAHAARTGLAGALLGLPRTGREERALRRRALDLLARLDADGVADRYPPAIPYGIQKRVALARALIAEPTLLLLDEPASGLAADELTHLQQVLHELRSRMGVVLVEHHMDLVMAVCDRVVVLDSGRVIAAGTPAEVRANQAVTVAYLGPEVTTAGAAGDA
jgi:branched-chain amino acid transport system ATP-binding protein